MLQGETGPDTKDGNAGATKSFDANMALSEEVNRTHQGVSEYGDGNDYQSESHSEGHKDEDVDEYDEEEENNMEHPGEVSIGKKLWSFLTT